MGGFAVLCLYGAALFALLGTAWFSIMPPKAIPTLQPSLGAGPVRRLSRRNSAVFAARRNGDRRTRDHVARRSGPLAFSSTVIDLTVEMVAQIAFC